MLGKIIALVEQHAMHNRVRPVFGLRENCLQALPVDVKREQKYRGSIFRDGIIPDSAVENVTVKSFGVKLEGGAQSE